MDSSCGYVHLISRPFIRTAPDPSGTNSQTLSIMRQSLSLKRLAPLAAIAGFLTTAQNALAQLSCATSGVPVAITFDATLSGVCEGCLLYTSKSPDMSGLFHFNRRSFIGASKDALFRGAEN